MINQIRILIILLLYSGFLQGQAIPVSVQKTSTGYTLIRNNEPYYIQGAGGDTQIKELLFLGGNSIRTWSADDAEEVLDLAHKNGLTVMMGLWVQHERHGFNYDDELAVKKQLERFTSIVKKLKDHPALLLWGIGNEVDLFYSNTKVWDAVQDIAAMIHSIDPNHPTSTVTAGLDSMEVQLIKSKAPDIDIYGINTYGDIAMVKESLRKFGWDGPYIIAEWGPNGHWEVPKTEWGAPIEQSSTEKAASYKYRYSELIQKDPNCVGSYVFLWGQKQETTSTWYGLFTENGNPTEPLDELYLAWRGKEMTFKAPSINTLQLNMENAENSIYLKSGEEYTANLSYKTNGNNKVKIDWYVYPESSAQSAGGDFESSLQPELGLLKNKKDTSVTVIAPPEEGAYRLFVFLRNQKNRTAYANIPFYVIPRNENDPEPKKVKFKRYQLNDELKE